VAEQGWLTYADFADRVGERFDLPIGEDSSTSLELVEALEGSAAGGSGPAGQQRLQFSLVFRGPAEPALAQGTWEMRHADLGELALFLVPIGPDGDGMRYEAAFA